MVFAPSVAVFDIKTGICVYAVFVSSTFLAVDVTVVPSKVAMLSSIVAAAVSSRKFSFVSCMPSTALKNSPLAMFFKAASELGRM